MTRPFTHMLLATAALLGAAPFAIAAGPAIDAAGCAALTGQAEPGLKLLSADWMPAGVDEAAKAELPAHCKVTGVRNEFTGAQGIAFGERFELRLPADWNGRFYFQGGGGLDGRVRPAIGSGKPGGTPPAVALGYAVISTDAGHENPDGAFGFDERARRVWGYEAIKDVAETGKALTAAFYGAAPHHSYLVGCSNGGRQGMMASQRYPELFDGIVAGAPVFRMSRSHIDTAWGLQRLTAIAPKNADGAPVLSRALSDPDLALLSDDILAACDGLDGLADGLVSAVGQCSYDPARLQCDGAKAEGCLSADQVQAVRDIHQGSRDSAGRAWYVPWLYDPGIGDRGWRSWRLGRSETAVPDAIKAGLSNNGVKHVFLTPADPSFSTMEFDFDTDPARMEASAAFADAVSTDLDAFKAHGGKLLLYHGVADPAISANDTARYVEALTARGGAATGDFARFFMVPGMGHCGGGKGLNEFDVLSAIVAWVEQGAAPAALTATGAYLPGVSRPLCPYPAVARYDGAGDPAAAASFSCR